VSDITVPVRVMIPAAQYRHLSAVADAHGTTVAALAQELMRRGAQANGVGEGYASVRGVTEAPLPEKADDIRRLHAAGHTDAEIARMLGLTLDTVKGRRQRLGLRSTPGRRPPAVQQRLSEQAFKTIAAQSAEKSK
jgi:DNA invertase Pin-like site-specific DNA recombinase